MIRALSKRENLFLVIFLAVVTFVYVLHKNTRILQQLANTTIIDLKAPGKHHNSDVDHPDERPSFCKLSPLLPENAQEASVLVDSIAWPETPVLPDPFPLEQSSDPAHSSFTILPRKEGGQWHVGDQLEAKIQISDFRGHPKKTGGDLIYARLTNPELGAGVAGQVVDHLNGSYTAVFTLVWIGMARVEVMLAHPSEAITVLKRLNIEQPDRMHFQSTFRSGSLSETTTCNVCLRQPWPKCNFSDPSTGEPWFCYKPKKLSCDHRITHGTQGFKQDLKQGEEKLFQNNVNMKILIKASGPRNVTALAKEEGQSKVKSSIATSGLKGYYYKLVWRALDGTKVRQFSVPATIECLRGKEVHMFGDSTIRMWFEFLTSELPDLKEFFLYSPGKVGPHMSLDPSNKILVTSRFHGVPLRTDPVAHNELRYTANEIDHLLGGPHVVVVIGVWAHFGTFPIELYISRLQNIRRSVVKLLNRAPATKILIRTGNPKALNLFYALTNSDFYTVQSDKVLRTMFKGLNVRFIYAWEMVVAHQLPHNLHPTTPIIKDMMDVLLSYVCPNGGREVEMQNGLK